MMASDIYIRSAALLNDQDLAVFTYTVQEPYLNQAIDDLKEEMELNNVPVTNVTSAVIPVAIGENTIGDTTGPQLPSDLVEIQALYEKQTGVTEDYLMMTRFDYLPLVEFQVELLMYWSWQGEIIRLLGATTDRDVKIEYIGSVISAVTSSTDTITVINSKSFLAYRTAALCAQFIGENIERSTALNMEARLALNKMLGIVTKGRQAINTRRRPFMSAYKSTGGGF